MLCPVLEKGISLNFLSGVLQTQPNLAQQHCHPSLPSLSPWRIRQTSRKDAVPSFRSLRRARHCAQERVQETPLVTRGQLSESPMVSLGSDFSVARAPEPVPHPVIRQQVAEALRGRAREGAPHSWAGGSSSGFQSSAPAPPAPSAAQRPRRPPPASARTCIRSERLACRHRRRRRHHHRRLSHSQRGGRPRAVRRVCSGARPIARRPWAA